MRYILVLVLFLLSFCQCLANEKAKEVYNFFKGTEYSEVADIIAAQGALESAWYKNKSHVEKNNYFSILDPKKKDCRDNQVECMLTYRSLKKSCEALLRLLRSRKYSTNREGYIADLEHGPGGNKRLRYAEDPHYVVKVLNAVNSLYKKGIVPEEVIYDG